MTRVLSFLRLWLIAALLLSAGLALGARVPELLAAAMPIVLALSALVAAGCAVLARTSNLSSPTTTGCGSAPDSKTPDSQVLAVAGESHNTGYGTRPDAESPWVAGARLARDAGSFAPRPSPIARVLAARWPASLRRSSALLAVALVLAGCATTPAPVPTSTIDVKAYWPNPAMAGQYRLAKLTGNHDGWAFTPLAENWIAFSITDANCSVDFYFWLTFPGSPESLVQPISTGSHACPADGAEARLSIPPQLWLLPRRIDAAALPMTWTTQTRDALVTGETATSGRTTITMRVFRDGELYAVQWRDPSGHGETLWAGLVPICGTSQRAPGVVRYQNTWGNDATYCWAPLERYGGS